MGQLEVLEILKGTNKEYTADELQTLLGYSRSSTNQNLAKLCRKKFLIRRTKMNKVKTRRMYFYKLNEVKFNAT